MWREINETKMMMMVMMMVVMVMILCLLLCLQYATVYWTDRWLCLLTRRWRRVTWWLVSVSVWFPASPDFDVTRACLLPTVSHSVSRTLYKCWLWCSVKELLLPMLSHGALKSEHLYFSLPFWACRKFSHGVRNTSSWERGKRQIFNWVDFRD